MEKFSFGNATKTSKTIVISQDEEKTVTEYFQKNRLVLTTTSAVEYLLARGWSISQVCSVVTYKEDSKKMGENGKPIRKEGEQLRYQHVHHIKDKWELKNFKK